VNYLRLIPISEAKEGMIVGQTIYGVNGDILVKVGTVITNKYIEKLKSFYWKYIYIDDEYSKNVEIKCTITTEVRNKAIQFIKALYLTIQTANKDEHVMEKYSKVLHNQMQSCLGSIDMILDDIITENISLVDVFDVKLLENYKYAHSVNVCIISLVLGKALGLNTYDLYKLGVGAFFHDMGQMFIPLEVLNKEDVYTAADYKIMNQHTELGYRYAKDTFNLPTTSYLAILQHHERFDGTGYPQGKANEEISLYGRIVAVADVFDALTAPKKYREAMTPVNAFKYLINNSGKAFDPKIVKLFISKVSPYPIGFSLELENDTEAIVMENYENKPFNPKLLIFKEGGVLLEKPYTKNL
jgi:HD-GYP domain-containing protein (c-di-GMP phosphodiesterase class II)